MRICVVGAGYVGLVSGTCFSDFGHNVTCIDKDEARVAAFRRGEIPIYEPDLDGLVARNAAAGRLQFTTDIMEAAADCDVVFLAVGTPSRRGNGHADLSHVFAAASELAAVIKPGCVVVTKSTVPVGTGDEVEARIRSVRPDLDFSVASNPEFLREGAAIEDFKRPDRIVVGAEDERARAVMTAVYRPLFVNKAPLLFTSRRTAELIKYAANGFLATKIAFINEIADLCEEVGADIQKVSQGIGLDNRIGPKFLHAGPGFGGSCFPKDTRALAATAREYNSPLSLVETVIASNEIRKERVADKVVQACGGTVANKTIAILGLTFKPNTDDMRESPAIAVVEGIQDRGGTVVAYDPQGMEQAATLLSDVSFAPDEYACVKGADAVVLITEWDVFRALDLDRVKNLMAGSVFVDLRNVYTRADVEAAGFQYSDVGRGSTERDGRVPQVPADPWASTPAMHPAAGSHTQN